MSDDIQQVAGEGASEGGGRRTREGRGAAARRASRTGGGPGPSLPYITRKIREYEVLDEEGLQLIEANADRILEEIGMYGDTPDDVCYEKLMTGCFHGALGRPVLGKSSTLAAMSGETLRGFKENHYTAGNIVLSLAGSFTQEQVDLLAKKFSCLPKAKKEKYSKASYTAHTVAKKKNTEQNRYIL